MLAIALVSSAVAVATPTGRRQTSLEQGILREVNRQREAHGLRPVASSPQLSAAATFQTHAMLSQGIFGHDSPAGGTFGSRLRRFYSPAGARSWAVGENLLWSAAGLDPQRAVRMWLGSPPHRRIMLDPTWREAGVGAVAATSAPGVYASNGPVVVVTMDFGLRVPASHH